MGTVLSSPKAGDTWHRLRQSKSTFSLKEKGTSSSTTSNGGGGGGGGGILRHGLAGSVRRAAQQRSEQQRSEQQRSEQQRSEQQRSEQQRSEQQCRDRNDQRKDQLRPCDRQSLHCNWHSARRAGLTKSTSCHAIKTFKEEKENRATGENRRLVVQANTTELLKCMGAFLRSHCDSVACEPSVTIGWIRSVDRSLILQGWADMAFVNPPNLVFLFMLVKTAVTPQTVASQRQLQATLLSCMYVAYSYMGNEISYPLKPFLTDEGRDAFWDRCLGIVVSRSSDMLRINSDPTFFIELFTELKSYS